METMKNRRAGNGFYKNLSGERGRRWADSLQAYLGSWVLGGCPCSWAGTFHWETPSVDLRSVHRRPRPDTDLTQWTGLRSARWRPQVHSGGPLWSRCSPSPVPAWWGSGGRAGSCRENQGGGPAAGSTGRHQHLVKTAQEEREVRLSDLGHPTPWTWLHTVQSAWLRTGGLYWRKRSKRYSNVGARWGIKNHPGVSATKTQPGGTTSMKQTLQTSMVTSHLFTQVMNWRRKLTQYVMMTKAWMPKIKPPWYLQRESVRVPRPSVYNVWLSLLSPRLTKVPNSLDGGGAKPSEKRMTPWPAQTALLNKFWLTSHWPERVFLFSCCSS